MIDTAAAMMPPSMPPAISRAQHARLEMEVLEVLADAPKDVREAGQACLVAQKAGKMAPKWATETLLQFVARGQRVNRYGH